MANCHIAAVRQLLGGIAGTIAREFLQTKGVLAKS
jgi:hypothetical protein